MSGSPAPRSTSPAPSLYERWGERLTDWCPYVTLALSSILSVAWSKDSAGERLLTAGLVVFAAVWVHLGYTRAPRPRKAHPVRMLAYFIGLLLIASVLALREYLFFIFLITGFFHAMVLRPLLLLIGGVFATSILVNTVIGGFPQTPNGGRSISRSSSSRRSRSEAGVFSAKSSPRRASSGAWR